MYVPDIIIVKEHLENLKNAQLIQKWELPYENLLTRRSAAIFFVMVKEEVDPEKVWTELKKYDNFSVITNTEMKLSKLQFRITFSLEEKENNQKSSEQITA